jgi:hypothetical protein
MSRSSKCWLMNQMMRRTLLLVVVMNLGNTLTKTTGIPPRTGLDPSNTALDETKRRSTGSGEVTVPDFQEMTEAP